MRARLAIALILIVIAPLGALSWLGARVAKDDRRRLKQEWEQVLLLRLSDVDQDVSRFISDRRRALEEVTDIEAVEAATLRERTRNTAFVKQLFVLGRDGRLAYPKIDGSLSQAERDFLRRTRRLWSQGDVFERPDENGKAAVADDGWYAWYWENGLNLIFWKRGTDGRIVGAELDRIRLMADIVAQLPSDTPNAPALRDGRIALIDARGAPVYLWGAYEPAAGEAPRVERALSEPLSSWRLRYFVSPKSFEAAMGAGATFSTFLGVLAIGFALAGLAAYFYRESARELREATQRVGFVNQVSHELKTPLTNIRMYAELLERELHEATPKAQRQLSVIVSESQRLSRLISNVLTFARQQKKTLTLVPSRARVDEIIEGVVTQFTPSLERRKIEVDLDLSANDEVEVDRDVLSQIVANLIGNVEKYASQGQSLRIESRRNAERCCVVVSDKGPGIPSDRADAVFRPFVRLRDEITEGVSGTGIGLALARDLARLHGGDLRLLPSDEGAVFELTLHTPGVTS